MAVSAILWQAAATSRGTILTTQLNALANNTITAEGTAFDNSTNLDFYGWLELAVTFGSAPTDSVPTVDVYFSKSIDGTNYESAPVTGGVDCSDQWVCSFPVRKVTTAQKKIIGPILLPPGKWKASIDNQTGVAFPASGSTLSLYTDNAEAQ